MEETIPSTITSVGWVVLPGLARAMRSSVSVVGMMPLAGSVTGVLAGICRGWIARLGARALIAGAVFARVNHHQAPPTVSRVPKMAAAPPQMRDMRTGEG